ncbi:diguanylate cyclase domain protein, partial [Vibrio parahaemolyticus EKP-021]
MILRSNLSENNKFSS